MVVLEYLAAPVAQTHEPHSPHVSVRVRCCSAGAVAALRFALSHPLVEADEGLAGAAHHLQLTAAARAKRRDRPVRLAPLGAEAGAGAGAGSTLPVSGRAIKIVTVEGMLEGMRARLAALEGTLTSQLAALPQPQALAPAAGAGTGAVGAAGGAGGGGATGERGSTPMSGLWEEDDEPPASPDRASTPGGAFKPRGGGDDAASEMSALPDDVMDAIENSDYSESEGGGDLEDEDEDGFGEGGAHRGLTQSKSRARSARSRVMSGRSGVSSSSRASSAKSGVSRLAVGPASFTQQKSMRAAEAPANAASTLGCA